MNPYGRAGRPTPADHGTRARYLSSSTPCRCSACRSANARYEAQRAARAVARVDPTYGQQLRIPGT